MELPRDKFPVLNLPLPPLRVEQQEGKWVIFDPVRKRWVALTPEEWVRQHAIGYLMEALGYPRSLLRSEGGQQVHGMARRFDVLAYDRSGKPYLLMECKAPSVKISQDTFQQISAYNLTQKAPLLVVTNGMQHYCCRVLWQEKRYEWLQQIPPFQG